MTEITIPISHEFMYNLILFVFASITAYQEYRRRREKGTNMTLKGSHVHVSVAEVHHSVKDLLKKNEKQR